ncbi:hypothetical protein QAD02_012321 [Eretmocerus hayati]|uniref:Uncharacterized protein n=1 Tax=Eretmocerus hayati TaxID=131215 RepID=A0ACC2P1Z2_9HYME|nr:hypothetical protein QAD02_012321 [Eretmocerus hayati]
MHPFSGPVNKIVIFHGGTQSGTVRKPAKLRSTSSEDWSHWKNCFCKYYGPMRESKQKKNFYRYTGRVGKEILKKIYIEDPQNAKFQLLLFKFDVYFKYREVARKQDQSIDEYITYLTETIRGFESYGSQEIVKEKVLQDMVSECLGDTLRRYDIYKLSLSDLVQIWKDASVNGVCGPLPPAKKDLHQCNPVLQGSFERPRVGFEVSKRMLPKKFIKNRIINYNSKGHGYESVFGEFLDENVTWIRIDEPYLKDFYQRQNFLRFCELARKKCASLSTISLETTKPDSNDKSGQKKELEELKNNLAENKIELRILDSDTLHDRQIKLSTGYVIKIGRGLHYFQPTRGRYALGSYDLDLRPCLKTVTN